MSVWTVWVTYSCPKCGDSHELMAEEEIDQGRVMICGDCLYPIAQGCTCTNK